MQGSEDVDSEAWKLKRNEPYIMITKTDEAEDYSVIVESKHLISTTSFKDALLNLMSTYYTFDISYPKSNYPLLIFIQYFILHLHDQQKLPTTVSMMYTKLYGEV